MNSNKIPSIKSSRRSEPNQVSSLPVLEEMPKTVDFDRVSTAKEIDRLFAMNVDSSFEAGMDSVFSISLQKLYDEDPIFVLTLLPAKLVKYSHCPELLIEMLSWLSRQSNDCAQKHIRDLVIAGLNHESGLVRDAAASELVWLEGVAAKKHLEHAIQRESIPELKEYMFKLLTSLERL